MYIVKAGAFNVVARSPSEALRIRERLLKSATDVLVVDMQGCSLDIADLRQVVKEIGKK